MQLFNRATLHGMHPMAGQHVLRWPFTQVDLVEEPSCDTLLVATAGVQIDSQVGRFLVERLDVKGAVKCSGFFVIHIGSVYRRAAPVQPFNDFSSGVGATPSGFSGCTCPSEKSPKGAGSDTVRRLHAARGAAAALRMARKSPATRLAPPTRAPSMSGWAQRAAALDGLTLPPYWMRISAADSFP